MIRVALVSVLLAGCSSAAVEVPTASDASSEAPDASPDASKDSSSDASGDAGPDGAESGTTCASAATTEACVTCCRQPDAPNFGGFELYASDLCAACPSCRDLSPCGTNVTPPAGGTCVACLQTSLSRGLPGDCASNAKCSAFAGCLASCPIR